MAETSSNEQASGVVSQPVSAGRETNSVGSPGESESVWTSVNVYGFTFGVFGTVLLTRLASFLTPYKLYFSFSSLLFEEGSKFKWESLAIKLLIPALVGFLLFYLPFRWLIWTSGSPLSYRRLFRYLSREARLTATTVGFFAALLSAWPFIVYWDILQRPDRLTLQFQYDLVYLLYFISYGYFAGFGVSLAQALLRHKLPALMTQSATARVAWFEAVRTSFLGLMTSAIATYAATLLSQANQ